VAGGRDPDDLKVLFVGGEIAGRTPLTAALRAEGYSLSVASSVEEALQILREEVFDVIIVGSGAGPEAGSVEAVRALKSLQPETAILLIAGPGQAGPRTAALRAGAFQVLLPPVDPEELLFEIGRASEYRELARQNRHLRRQLVSQSPLADLVGSCAAMQEVRKRLALSIDLRSPVLIQGEPGTGKELAARIIHYGGPRKEQHFVPILCRGASRRLLEAELFGEERKGMPGWFPARRGAFEEASGGTLYLEEVGDLHWELQGRMLEMFEESAREAPARGRALAWDIRVIASSTRRLAELVRKGRFRYDLFAHLRVIEIAMPPLRERGADLVELTLHFMKRYEETTGKRCVLSPEAVLMLHGHVWPENVAELESALGSALRSNQSGILGPEDFPLHVQGAFRRGMLLEDFFSDLPSLSEVENRYLFHVLRSTGGNKAQAAAILGITRKTLYRMVERSRPGAPKSRKSRGN